MKLIKFVLAVCLCSICCVTGYAEENKEFSSKTYAPVGVLADELGNEYIVEGREVNPPGINSRSTSGESKTIEYTLRNLTRGSGHNSIDEADGSISVRVYLTIYYNYQGSNYLLTSVSGYWTFLDNGVEVTSAKVSYGCSGGEATQSVEDRSVSNYYNINTGFTTYIPNSIGVMGQELTLALKMTNPNGTTRTWSFKVGNHLFNTIA